MASHMDEPSTKKKRLDEEESFESQQGYKSIRLDMKKYDEWVHVLPEDQLVNIFDLGVKVKESVLLTVNVNQTFMEKTLSSQMKPIQKTVVDIEKEIKSPEGRVSQGLQVIKNDIKEEIKACCDKIDDISKNLVKPGVKGSVGEMTVEKILRRHFRNFSVEDVSRSRQKIGDIIVTTTSNDKIIIEVKNYTSSVPLQESQKFEDNLASSPDYKAGILLSLNSGITSHATNGDFEVAFDQSQNQYRIYVPNALPRDSDESRVVWSVLMAEQLAKIRRELTGSQVEGLEEICTEFRENVEQSKVCKDSLRSLENAMTKLKQDIKPLFETVNKTKERLSTLLHQ